jgi:hypothetical protein
MTMPTFLFARTNPSPNSAPKRGTRVLNPNKDNVKQRTNERISAFDAIGFNWTSQENVTRSFDKRIDDLEEYKQTTSPQREETQR